MRRHPLAPPERLTVADLLRTAFGVVMIPLGAIILVRTLSLALTAQGVLVGLAFVGFGVHRTWLACGRYGLYRQRKRGTTRWT